MLEKFIPQLVALRPLTEAQVNEAVEALVNETVSAATKADFLVQLARKGETIEEIAAFVRALRGKSIEPPLDPETRSGEILDVCGTGGDRLGTFNISTTVALVCAAAGVTVAKHGNRAITSQSGSADVLETLGVRIDLTPAEAARSLYEHNFAFFFAPNYHPAFKHIAPARKLCAERGQRTIFNFLGPLLNPVRPSAQLIGVPRPELCDPVARVLQSLDVRRGMAVCGSIPVLKTLSPFGFDSTNRIQNVRVIDIDGKSPPAMSVPAAIGLAQARKATLVSTIPDADPPVYRLIDSQMIQRLRLDDPQNPINLDELSCLGPNTVAEFYQERGFARSTLAPEQFPLQPATLADLLGGDRDVNAEIIRRILHGEERGPKRDAVLLNAGAALLVAGQVKSISGGWELAAQVIDDGKAQAKLRELVAR